MKKKIMRAISYILTLLFLLSAITACADSPDDVTDPPESTEAAINSGNSSESATGEATSDKGEKLQYSTVDAMLVPEELTCTLQNLADEIEVQ